MRVVAIGASWGGLHAVGTILAGLDADFPAAVVLAQHRDERDDPGLLPELLGRRTALPVADADDKDELRPGRVLIAPAGYHLLVENGVALPAVALSTEGPVQFSRPSIDVLFESVADACEADAVGVVLTGANADGAAGLAEIVRRGGAAIVQDPETSERREMPSAAREAVPQATVATLEEIPALLARLVAA